MNDVDVDDINDLAQFIRQINGDNKMGAAELAENILEWQSGKAHDVEPVCDCISLEDGFWQQRCDCHNSGDLAEAQSWCDGANTHRQLQQAEARLAELEQENEDALKYMLWLGGGEDICRVKAMILRKQAEAVEDAANYVVGLGDKRTLLHYVQCLRQQADELEQN